MSVTSTNLQFTFITSSYVDYLSRHDYDHEECRQQFNAMHSQFSAFMIPIQLNCTTYSAN